MKRITRFISSSLKSKVYTKKNQRKPTSFNGISMLRRNLTDANPTFNKAEPNSLTKKIIYSNHPIIFNDSVITVAVSSIDEWNKTKLPSEAS